MKYKEKEKLWLNKVKELAKDIGWKFKGYFIFKKIDDFYFSAYFYVGLKDNVVTGWLDFKPYNSDNVFWDFIDELPNKNRPLSFRAEAAFCVRSMKIWDYRKNVSDEENPHEEIKELLSEINLRVIKKLEDVKTLADFQIELLKEERLNSVGIITTYIEQNNYKEALTKIEEFKSNKIKSGYGFGSKDFYDLAKEYCEKTIANHT